MNETHIVHLIKILHFIHTATSELSIILPWEPSILELSPQAVLTPALPTSTNGR